MSDDQKLLSKVDWKKNQPAVKALARILPLYFPELRESGKGINNSGVGGYNNRKTKSGSFSGHSEGRAADIYLDAFNCGQKEFGDALFQMFINFHSLLGVEHVIWNKQIWSLDSGGPREYESIKKNGPHTNHIHVLFTRIGSQQDLESLHGLIGFVWFKINPLSLTLSNES